MKKKNEKKTNLHSVMECNKLGDIQFRKIAQRHEKGLKFMANRKDGKENGLIELIEQLPTFITYNTKTEKYSENYNSFESDRCGFLTIVHTGRYWEISYGAQYSEDFIYGLFGCDKTFKGAIEDISQQVKTKLFNK